VEHGLWVEFSAVRRKSDISGNISPPILGSKDKLKNQEKQMPSRANRECERRPGTGKSKRRESCERASRRITISLKGIRREAVRSKETVPWLDSEKTELEFPWKRQAEITEFGVSRKD
jgi:hypothetical protein